MVGGHEKDESSLGVDAQQIEGERYRYFLSFYVYYIFYFGERFDGSYRWIFIFAIKKEEVERHRFQPIFLLIVSLQNEMVKASLQRIKLAQMKLYSQLLSNEGYMNQAYLIITQQALNKRQQLFHLYINTLTSCLVFAILERALIMRVRRGVSLRASWSCWYNRRELMGWCWKSRSICMRSAFCGWGASRCT